MWNENNYCNKRKLYWPILQQEVLNNKVRTGPKDYNASHSNSKDNAIVSFDVEDANT
jgi:hypothetical protein